MKRIYPLLAAAGLLAGCAAPSNSPVKPASSVPATVAPADDRLDRLQKGMSADAVIALLGKPEGRKPFQSSSSINAEVWTYRENFGSEQQRYVPTSTRDVPYVDPFTGIQRMIQEPVYSLETIQIVRVSDLLLVDGSVAEWIVRQETRRSLL